MTETDAKEAKSRSQIKREYEALKDLAGQLVELSEAQLQRLGLAEKLVEATLAAKGMTRTALQRQRKYIAGLLAREDSAAIRAALGAERRPHAEEVRALHEAERWREELLAGDERLLARFVALHPGCDGASLGRLVSNARKEREEGRSPRAARLLFQYLKRLGPAARQ